MRYRRGNVVMSTAVLALLLVGVVPVASAQSGQTAGPSSSSANTLIQLAEAAQSYAQQLLTIGGQQGVNVTTAQGLMAKGGALLAQAQTEVNSNSTQAAIDALQSMKDFRMAAESLQSQVIVSVQTSDEEAYLQAAIQRAQNRTAQLQTIVTTACSSPNATASVCSDANSNLSEASADLTNASSLLAAITSSNAQSTMTQIVSLLKDTATHLQDVANDINELASSNRSQKAVQFITKFLEPKVTQLQDAAQKANLTSSQLQQVNGNLSVAQTDLTAAVQSLQSGNFTAGVSQTNDAIRVMNAVAVYISNQVLANYVQNTLLPRIGVLQAEAQKANLTSTVEQNVQSQLSQAQTDLNGAIQSYQSGDAKTGTHLVMDALQLMQMAQQEISHPDPGHS